MKDKPQLTVEKLKAACEALKDCEVYSERPIVFEKHVPELTDDRPAIRAALKESRRRHTTRVRSHLP